MGSLTSEKLLRAALKSSAWGGITAREPSEQNESEARWREGGWAARADTVPAGVTLMGPSPGSSREGDCRNNGQREWVSSYLIAFCGG